MIDFVFEIVRGHCNSKCQYCLMQGLNYRNKNFIDFNNFLKFVSMNKNSKKIGTVSLSGMGEQTLHPRFSEIVNTLDDNFNLGSINTNLAKKMSEEELRSLLRFKIIEVDIYAFNEDIRREISGREKDYLKENVEFIESLGMSDKLSLKAINTRKNLADIKGTHISVDSLILWREELFEHDKKEGFDYKEFYNNLVDDNISIIDKPLGTCCFYAAEEYNGSDLLVISPTGHVLLCYLIPYSSSQLDGLSPGNAFTSTLEEIVQTSKYEELKERLRQRRYLEGFCEFCSNP